MSSTTAPAQSADLLAPFHHPHFISVAQGRWEGEAQYTWKPFTGCEAEPVGPGYQVMVDAGLSLDDTRTIEREYRAAVVVWGQARFRAQAAPLLVAAAPVWAAYRQARTAMDDLFAGFHDTEDHRWRARILRLLDAHREAIAAAEAWDRTAQPLAVLQDAHMRTVGGIYALRLCDVDCSVRDSVPSWDVRDLDDYQGDWGRNLADGVSDEAEQQKRRLQEIAALAGDR